MIVPEYAKKPIQLGQTSSSGMLKGIALIVLGGWFLRWYFYSDVVKGRRRKAKWRKKARRAVGLKKEARKKKKNG